MSVTNRIGFCVFLFAAIYLLSRTPFYTQPLMGEEGLFAKVLVADPRAPNYLIAARVDGREYYDPAQHAGGMFVIIALAGRAFSLFEDLQAADEPTRTFWIRLIHSMPQMIIWILIGLVVATLGKSKLGSLQVFLILLVMLSPLALTSSLGINLDGSFGILMSGLVAVTFLVFADQEALLGFRKVGYVVISLAAAFLGLGKAEWTIALFFGSFLVTAYGVCGRLIFGRKTISLEYIAAALVGCAVGNMVSYRLDPLNYTLGWELTLRLTQKATFLDGNFARLLQLNKERLPYLITNFLLFAAVARMIVKSHFIMNTGVAFNLCFSLCLFSSFLLSTWNSEPRYFAPSLMPLLVCLVGLFLERITLRKSILFLLCGVFVAHAVLFLSFATIKHRSVAMYPGQKYCMPRDSWKLHLPKDRSCVPILDTAQAYNEADVDFVGSSLDREGARKLVESAGKRLCP